ncbi:Rap guanine nucleotide exchange factor 6 [Camelus dromedarius]|uniref:Rap guanine nucleotide exchange factor 6 n=1 Tax=Camelus dromedarius TaxID=9838 RepID=A0A5N4EEN5_CAMDR|nr:Rap guanine nucleotide exchange factor 6 [Camelus dromedarius]
MANCFGKRSAGSFRRGCECIVLEPSEMIVVDYMDENEEYFQRQASHRQSRRRFRKINQKGERQTIIDTVDPYPVGKPPLPRGYHTMERGHCRVCLETEVKSGTSAKQKTIDLALLTARLAHPRQAAESRVQCAVDTRCSFCWRVSIFIYDIIAAAELPLGQRWQWDVVWSLELLAQGRNPTIAEWAEAEKRTVNWNKR